MTTTTTITITMTILYCTGKQILLSNAKDAFFQRDGLFSYFCIVVCLFFVVVIAAAVVVAAAIMYTYFERARLSDSGQEMTTIVEVSEPSLTGEITLSN